MTIAAHSATWQITAAVMMQESYAGIHERFQLRSRRTVGRHTVATLCSLQCGTRSIRPCCGCTRNSSGTHAAACVGNVLGIPCCLAGVRIILIDAGSSAVAAVYHDVRQSLTTRVEFVKFIMNSLPSVIDIVVMVRAAM